jgi:DNA-binding response OmpR family regulator
MAQKILVVDDDEVILQVVTHSLHRWGYEVSQTSTSTDAMRLFYEKQPDLVILDVMMPNLSGWDLCQRIREISSTPIIMLTARDDPSDVIKGLRLGADDYVKKPFHLAEIQARVQALLRRASMVQDENSIKALEFDQGRILIDPQTRRVMVDNQLVQVTSKEYDLLIFLANHPGIVLTNEKIFENVWSYTSDAEIDNVKWYIWRLRKKIEKDTRNPELILTERGIGYRFMPD